MNASLNFDPIRLPPECVRLRQEVREFLRGEFDSGRGGRREAFNREFSRKVGAQGWIGMTWPQNTAAAAAAIWSATSSPRNFSPPMHPCGCTSSPTARAARCS